MVLTLATVHYHWDSFTSSCQFITNYCSSNTKILPVTPIIIPRTFIKDNLAQATKPVQSTYCTVQYVHKAS